jgi:predicted transposase YbfD/YdcC
MSMARPTRSPGSSRCWPDLDLHNTVITADAIHTQREHATWLVEVKHADYVLLVKDNQPAFTTNSRLCLGPTSRWPTVPATVPTAAACGFSHATQALRITRRVRRLRGRRWRNVTVYGLTSLTHLQASPARLADLVRGHWGIEALHHIRDVTFAEDASMLVNQTFPHVCPCERGCRSATWHEP